MNQCTAGSVERPSPEATSRGNLDRTIAAECSGSKRGPLASDWERVGPDSRATPEGMAELIAVRCGSPGANSRLPPFGLGASCIAPTHLAELNTPVRPVQMGPGREMSLRRDRAEWFSSSPPILRSRYTQALHPRPQIGRFSSAACGPTSLPRVRALVGHGAVAVGSAGNGSNQLGQSLALPE